MGCVSLGLLAYFALATTDTTVLLGVVPLTCGDLNGIGLELIIKSLSDSRILDFMIPVVFANNKSINF